MENTVATTSKIAFFKNSTYVMAFLSTLDYLNLAPVTVLVLSGLIIVDMLTGILRSATLHGWRSIQSNVAERGVLAKLLLVLVPFMVALAGKGIGLNLAPLAQSTITVMVLSELYSIVGNIYAIRTGVDKVEFDAMAFVLSKLKEGLKKIIVSDDEKK